MTSPYRPTVANLFMPAITASMRWLPNRSKAKQPSFTWHWLVLALAGYFTLLASNFAFAIEPQAINTNNNQISLLDVDIGLFDANVPNDVAQHRRQDIHPLVRKAESRYLPYVLLQTLNKSGNWGVVRVRSVAGQPASNGETDETAFSPLLITGVIEQSDGEHLKLTIRAVDCTKRVWLNQEYTAVATEADYEQTERDPFQPLFDNIAHDLQQIKSTLSPGAINSINEIAVLRYGEGLSPATFTPYLNENEEGLLHLTRLPARDDPMLQRVLKIREYEYPSIDTENEQYQRLFNKMKNNYHLWRQYRREMALYLQEEEAKAKTQKYPFERGSLASMRHVYGDYVWFRTQEQYINELSQGFNNEILPTVLEVDDAQITLSGDLDAKYEQWQSILQSLFELERGKTKN